MKFLASCVAVVVLLFAVSTPALVQPRVRVGVFDSRGIVIAYTRSAAFREQVQQFRAQFEKAKTANDANSSRS